MTESVSATDSISDLVLPRCVVTESVSASDSNIANLYVLDLITLSVNESESESLVEIALIKLVLSESESDSVRDLWITFCTNNVSLNDKDSVGVILPEGMNSTAISAHWCLAFNIQDEV